MKPVLFLLSLTCLLAVSPSFAISDEGAEYSTTPTNHTSEYVAPGPVEYAGTPDYQPREYAGSEQAPSEIAQLPPFPQCSTSCSSGESCNAVCKPGQVATCYPSYVGNDRIRLCSAICNCR